jgi:hypothetical protein
MVRLRVVLASALLAVLALGGPAGGSTARSGTRPQRPSTLAVAKERTLANETGTANYAFADGKLAWFPYRIPCRTPVHFLNLATGHGGALGRCDDRDRRELAIAGDAIYWLTLSASNTESVEKVYSASRGRTRLVASYAETGCDDEHAVCGADLFAGGGNAFVSHGGKILRIAGPRLEPVLSSPGSRFAAASWPYVALWHTYQSSSPFGSTSTIDVRVFRLTDGKHVRTFHDVAAAEGVVLSHSLLAALDLTGTTDRPRLIARIYELSSGRELAIIHDEAVIAIVGRQIVTRATGVPRSRVLVRSIGRPPRLIAETGDDAFIAQAFVHGRALSWIEEQSPTDHTRGFRLRKVDLEPR